MFGLPSPQELAIVIPVFLLALTIHEFAHAWVANRLGDPTARLQGRLTLNPMAHLDLVGTLAIIIFRIGWAKPVPVDLRYLRNPRRDFMLIAAAGPASNFVLAVIGVLCLGLVPWSMLGQEWFWLARPLHRMVVTTVTANVALTLFNLLPIPPLDGSRLVSYMLPLRHALAYRQFEIYGPVVIMLLFVTGIFDPIFNEAVRTVSLALLRMWG